MGLLFGWEYYVVLGQPFRGEALFDGISILLDGGIGGALNLETKWFQGWELKNKQVGYVCIVWESEYIFMGILCQNAPNSMYQYVSYIIFIS